MNLLKIISFSISASLFSGCVSIPGSTTGGARLVASGRSMPSGAYYAEAGVEFSTSGDFVALFSPSRWKEPIETGGVLSWTNPAAWAEDAGRTSRVLFGEVIIVGAVVAVAVAVDDGNDSDGGSSASTPTDPSGPPDPP